jgi:hypothetical protein
LLSMFNAGASPSWFDMECSGYLKDMFILTGLDHGFRGRDVSTKPGNILHMRQNISWYPVRNITCALEVKTRHFMGEDIRTTVEHNEGLASQATYFDWIWALADDECLSILTMIDRAWIESYLGAGQFTVGRQRIAWGTNWVWNPIDLFNPVSPLDFDTEEGPGSDAARVQYYTSPTSKLELAAAPSRESWRNVVAGFFKINRWEYDLYLVGGWKRSSGVVGAAWAGQVRGAGLRGEWLYVRPGGGREYTHPFTVAAVSADYVFPSSFYLHVEALYNSEGTIGEAGGERLRTAIDRGELSPARGSIFWETAYSFSPLLRTSISGIMNPFDSSWYTGPSASLSVATDVDLGATALIFGGEEGTEFGDMHALFLASLRISF